MDSRTYLNTCFADCLSGGWRHVGECRAIIEPKKCRCQNGNEIVCGTDMKLYRSSCSAGCYGIGVRNLGYCDLMGNHSMSVAQLEAQA